MAHPFPFAPEHVFGNIVEKDGSKFIIWMYDGIVEPESEGSATDAEIELLQSGVAALREMRLNFDQIITYLETQGYKDLGVRRWDFSSGAYYQYARVLAQLARHAADEREGILSRHGGEHPPMEHEDWPRWEEVTHRMGAASTGARMLGFGSIEALLNEILAVKYPDEYDRLHQSAGVRRKIERLYDLLNEPSPDWLDQLDDENVLRKGIAHHKPAYVDDTSPKDSVEPVSKLSAAGAEDFLALVDRVFSDIFALYGIETPVTHRSGSGDALEMIYRRLR